MNINKVTIFSNTSMQAKSCGPGHNEFGRSDCPSSSAQPKFTEFTEDSPDSLFADSITVTSFMIICFQYYVVNPTNIVAVVVSMQKVVNSIFLAKVYYVLFSF